MPAPSTVAEFVELVRKSGVVDEKRLDAYMDRLRAANGLPAEPGQLAGLFVRDGLLTLFQAKQIVELGRWRRFTIGKYKVLEQLGQGGMGSVYLCEHMLMRRRVAVKVLPTAKAEEPAALDRFYREARAVAALDHPNIVRAYDIDHAEKLHFLVMEYVDGASFQEIIKRTGQMDQVRAAHYIRQAALGLQHAHEQAGLVHRDIKPGNILVDRSGIVKILDMGLARFFHDDQDDLTKKHDENVLGTADYLAPEQALDSHGVDIRADIYSLGATFYFCLAARTPFAEGTVAQKLIWHQTRQPKPLKSIRPDVDDALVAIIERMMAKDANQRYQKPLEIVEALSPWTRTSIPPPVEAEMPRLSLAAMGMSTTSLSSDGGHGDAGRTGATPLTGSSKPSWQVATPSESLGKPPSTVRSATPPVKPASGTPRPASAPPARPAPPAAVPPIAQKPAPVANTPRPQTSPLLQEPVAPRPVSPQPAVALTPASEEAVPWEQFANDTADLSARVDTGPDSGRKRLRLTQSQEADRTRRRLYLIMGIIGLVVMLVAGIIIWRVLSTDGGHHPVRPDTRSRQAMTFYVGPDAENPTIAGILNKLRPGDTVIVQTDVLREQLHVDTNRARTLGRIRIEADPKRPGPVVWKPPEKADKTKPIIQLEDAEEFTIKGFTFDGEDRINNLIELTCGCKGVVLDGLKLQHYQETGVCFINCMAPKTNPVVLTNVQAAGDKPPLVFDLRVFYKDFPRNENILVQDDCKFSGNFKIKLVYRDKPEENRGVRLPAGLPREDVKLLPPKQ